MKTKDTEVLRRYRAKPSKPDPVKHQNMENINIIIISGFGIYGAAVVPDSGVGNASHSFSMNSCLTG